MQDCNTAGRIGSAGKSQESAMAKKDSFDDVLGNKMSLMNAKSSKLLSSWMGDQPAAAPSANDVSDLQDEDADLKQTTYGHDRCVQSRTLTTVT